MANPVDTSIFPPWRAALSALRAHQLGVLVRHVGREGHVGEPLEDHEQLLVLQVNCRQANQEAVLKETADARAVPREHGSAFKVLNFEMRLRRSPK